MQKLRHKTVVNTSLLFQKFQGLAGVDSGSVKFRLTFLFRIFVVLLQLRSNSQESRPFDCARCANKKNGNVIRKQINFSSKKHQETFLTLLH